MKKLFTSLFGRKNQFNYVFTAYQPQDALYDQDEALDPMTLTASQSKKQLDEMSIDNIYQSR